MWEALQLVYFSQFLGNGEDPIVDVAMTTERRLSPITLGCQTGWTVSSSIDYARRA